MTPFHFKKNKPLGKNYEVKPKKMIWRLCSAILLLLEYGNKY